MGAPQESKYSGKKIGVSLLSPPLHSYFAKVALIDLEGLIQSLPLLTVGSVFSGTARNQNCQGGEPGWRNSAQFSWWVAGLDVHPLCGSCKSGLSRSAQGPRPPPWSVSTPGKPSYECFRARKCRLS